MEFLGPLYGYFLAEGWLGQCIVAALFVVLLLGYHGAPFWLWTITLAVGLVGFGAPPALLILFVAVAVVFNIPPLRKALVSSIVMKTMKALELIPKISQTERTALEAGVVWREADLFSGKPDLKKLMNEPWPQLSADEQRFLDNEVEELCRLIDDWKFWRTRKLPEAAFKYMCEKGFLGMIIPKEYGGHGFSHSMHSAVVQKVSTRSIAATIYVMVPNSLGPAELLVHYGTDAQKKKYLPRLAKGLEIPCFGLTEPLAGSDAGSITSTGILFKDTDGQIKIRLNFRKRWITMASISTLLGLAFQLRDPANLLGKGEDLGITCALIPSNLPGIILGKRHDPLGVPFHNCPMEGHDVIVGAEESIIGGLNGAGKGWGMLMECLGAGRGISLPGESAGGSKVVARVTSNHCTIRKQFGLPIGKFEGVEEPLARIAGHAYMLEAMRKYILSALDQGISPPVCTAIAKYNSTEMARETIRDGMDILGGAGISMGPRNIVATSWIGIPISITVEGANILTRTLMIFGQGALRAHPYAFKEVNAIEKGDLGEFDNAFWGHIGHIVRNMFRSLVLTFTRGYVTAWGMPSQTRRYFQMLSWSSASFAILTDLAMGLLGGQLKVKEKLTGRFADIISWLFIATSVLRRYEAEGRQKEDWPLVEYSLKTAFHKIQIAFDGIYANMDVPLIGLLFKGPVRWWSKLNLLSEVPSDRLVHHVANALMNDQGVRDRLTVGMYMPKDPNEAIGNLERAYAAVKKAETVDAKVKAAVKTKTIPKKKGSELYALALEKGVISRPEFELLAEAEKLRYDAVQVDEFTEEEYAAGYAPNSKITHQTPLPTEMPGALLNKK